MSKFSSSLSALLPLSLALSTSITFASEEPTYSVPVAAHLKAFAEFKLQNFVYTERSANRVRLAYDLPVELVGRAEMRVEFSGTKNAAGEYSLSGPNGKATCTEVGPDYDCEVLYENLEIEASAVEKVLRQTSKSPLEFGARMAVAAKFSGEPIGTVRYRD